MRKIVLLFSFLIFCGVLSAQESNFNRRNTRKIESPEGMARSEASKMRRELNLTDKQYDKLYSLFLKENQSAIKSMSASGARGFQGGPRGGRPGGPDGAGPGGGFGGGEGMPGNGQMGGPGRMGGRGEGDFKAPMQNGSKPMTPEQMQKQREKRDKKISKIIGKEKFAMWQEKHLNDFNNNIKPEKPLDFNQ